MQVTIIGAGHMGRGIGTRLVAGGHSVTIIDRNFGEAQRLANELNQGHTGGASVAKPCDIAGEVVVLALYYPGNRDLARKLGNKLANKVVVDIANPIDFATFEPATAPDTSSAEEGAAVVPASARVVKAFNTTFAGTLVASSVAGQALDVFLAGDAEQAKQTLAQHIRDGGLNALDVGPLRRARQLEGMGFVHIVAQGALNGGHASALKILTSA